MPIFTNMESNDYSSHNRDYSGDKRDKESSGKNFEKKRSSYRSHDDRKGNRYQDDDGERPYRKSYNRDRDNYRSDDKRYSKRKGRYDDDDNERPYKRRYGSDNDNYQKKYSGRGYKKDNFSKDFDEEDSFNDSEGFRKKSYSRRSYNEEGYNKRRRFDKENRDSSIDYRKKYTRNRDTSEGDDTKYSRRRSSDNKYYERKSSSDWSNSQTFFSKEKKERKYSGSKRQDKEQPQETDEIRLNRYISNSGICSRREADELIQRGEITVNGVVVTELGTRVHRNDTVQYKGKTLSFEKPVYILMNKPKDCVTTMEDPHAELTVIDLLHGEVPERVYPVGRLDKDTTGVLLLTNDGELATKLMHPTFERVKIYHVFLDRPVSKNDLVQLTEGVDLDGELVYADTVSYPDPEDKTQLGIEIHSGQNRVVRRMMEAIGYKVKKLDRVYFAGLTKKNVRRGEWRYLTEKEINMLKRGIY